jgi:hypothetical protein
MITVLGTLNAGMSATGGVTISDQRRDFFVARIDSVGAPESGSGSGCGIPHGWTEQDIPQSGCDYENKQGGRSGTTTLNPAYALGGGAATVGQLVLMWLRGVTNRDAGEVYDFIGNGISAGTGSGSGSGGSGAGTACIPFVESIACVNGSLSVTTKYLRISGATASASDTACNSGSG